MHAKIALASVVGGLILFVWGAVSHVGLGWYDPVYHELEDDSAALEVLERQAPRSGLYYLPHDYEAREDSAYALVNIVLRGEQRGFGAMMGIGLVLHFFAVLLVTLMLVHRMPERYWCRVGSYTAAGLIIAFVAKSYYWNWFGFPALYLALSLADALVGWTLVGLAAAAILRAGTTPSTPGSPTAPR